MEIPRRQDAAALGEDEWIVGGGVELGDDGGAEEIEGGAGGAVHRGDAAEAERVLNGACRALLPERAAGEKAAQRRRGVLLAGGRPGGGDLLQEWSRIGAQPLEAERGGERGEIEQSLGLIEQ